MRPFDFKVFATWVTFFVPALCNPCIAQVGQAGRPPGTLDSLPEIRRPAEFNFTPPARPLPPEGTPQKLKVTGFRFTGLTAFDAADLLPVVAAWLGRELAAAELEEVLQAVTRYLRERGLFVAYAYLPIQQVTDGGIEIAVLEGRLGAVNLERAPGSRAARRTIEGFLSGLQRETLIGRGSFDTPLLLLNDLPGIRVTPHLSPGRAAAPPFSIASSAAVHRSSQAR